MTELLQETKQIASIMPNDVVVDPITKEATTPPHKKNVYPLIRHILFVVIILLCVASILFLMHRNGESLYDHGI